MLDWLSIFYNGLLSTWHSELTWCTQVFGNPGTVLCLLMSQTLNHVEPPFSVCVKEFVRDEAYPMQQLIDLKQVSVWLNRLRNVTTHTVFEKERSVVVVDGRVLVAL